MTISLIPTAQINEGVRKHLTLAEAAADIGCSEARIRRAARKLGVQRIAGRTVHGGILITGIHVPIVIAYAA